MAAAIPYRDLSCRVRGSIFTVFEEPGPGFLEEIYQNALGTELTKRGIPFEAQKEMEVYYDGIQVGIHRLGSVGAEEVVLELKAVDDLHSQHEAQIISYLKASGLSIGFLINFGGKKAKIKRYTNTV